MLTFIEFCDQANQMTIAALEPSRCAIRERRPQRRADAISEAERLPKAAQTAAEREIEEIPKLEKK